MQSQSIIHLISGSLVLIALCILHARELNAESDFRGSAVTVNITPDHSVYFRGYGMPGHRENPVQEVHDSLFLRAACLESSGQRLLIISADLLDIPTSYYETFCARIQKQYGLSKHNIFWCCTHNHSGPNVGFGKNERYSEQLLRMALIAAGKALDILEPARIGWVSSIALANMNRRAVFPSASGEFTGLGKNPDLPIDRELGIIRLDDANGKLMAVIANYAMHGTALYPTVEKISGDAMGVATTYAEQKLGVPVLFINGAAADLDPVWAYRDSLRSNNFDIGMFRHLLGDQIILAQSMANTTDRVRLASHRTHIPLPRRAGRAHSEGPVYNLETSYILINDLAIFSSPVELFTEIALRIKKESPFSETFFFGFTNGGDESYLPSSRAFGEGGYEVLPTSTPFDHRAEKIYVNGVLHELNRLYLSSLAGSQ